MFNVRFRTTSVSSRGQEIKGDKVIFLSPTHENQPLSGDSLALRIPLCKQQFVLY